VRICLKVNAKKIKYIAMFRKQHAGTDHKRRQAIKLSERVKQFRYLGLSLTHQNLIHEEIKSRLKSWHACYLRCRIFCLPFYFPKI
jgi:hypothetical protein